MKEWNKKKKLIPFIQFFFVLAACLIFHLAMLLIEQKSFGGVVGFFVWHSNYFWKSYILIVLLYAIFLISGNFWIPTIVTGVICYLFAMVNYFKIQFRGEPLLPWDIYAFSEASKVVGTLDLEFSFINLFCLFLLSGVVFVSFKIPVLPFKNKNGKRFSCLLVSITSLFCMIYYVNHTYFHSDEWPDPWFRIEYYNQHGLVNSFLYNFRYLSMEEPEGYSKAKIKEILQDMEQRGVFEQKTTEQTPNIIFIMSESFWDASALPSITFEEELLPNLNYLRENFISGEVLSPKFGGGTSNVEFEALTGFTNDTLPDGCIPYQQYIKENFFSFANFLKNKGYDTLAIHSDEERNWNRYKAYPNMGFDDFISSEDMDNPEMIRGRISDMAVTEEIIKQYENQKKISTAPWFNFTVTVQNHTGYHEDNFEENEKMKFESNMPLSKEVQGQLSDFATGIHYSDQALGKLIDYFSQEEEPTILLFFGDHRTNLGYGEYQVFYETNYLTEDTNDLEKSYLTHTTPLMAWSNENLIQKELGCLAPYQILPAVLDCYGLEKPKFFLILDELRRVSTGYHLGIMLNAAGVPISEITLEQKNLYQDYAMLQYDYIIGKGYCKEWLFDL